MKDKFNKRIFEEGFIASVQVQKEEQPVQDIQEFLQIDTGLLWRIFFSRDIAHIKHLQTGSYAEHKALNEYYDNIVELVDGLIESIQGEIKAKVEFSTYTITQANVSEFESFLSQLKQDIDIHKKTYSSDVENKLEEIKNEINSLLYKLNFLK